MAKRLKKTDVVIVGLGAGGGIAAYVLTKAGMNVVGLEAGGRFSPQDEQLNELGNSFHFNIFGRAKANLEVPTWRPNASTPTVPSTASPGPPALMMNGVGGSSIHYATQSWRLLPWNFQTRSATINRYGASAIPAGSTVADWPLTYDELEPYYDHAEYAIGISGKAGNIRGKIQPGGDTFEGPRSREYPLPPLRQSGYTELVAGAGTRLGWHPFMGPSSVHSEPFKGAPACTYCGFCNNGCFTSAKGSTDLHVIPAAEATRKLSIVTHARVTQVTTDKDGRVTGVLYLKGGKEFFQPASVVLLATFTYENARLLLLSTSSAFPNGLSNNHGQVGKHYMSHNSTANVLGLFPGRKLNRWSGLGAQATVVSDWDADNFDHSGLGFIGGGTIQGAMQLQPISAASTPPPPSLGIPNWGSAWKAWLKQNANSVGTLLPQIETLPYEDNYLDLDPTTRDTLGYPVIRATFDLQQNDRLATAFLQDKGSTWLKEAGASVTWKATAVPIGAHAHAYGGTRMGNDPAASVVDQWSFSHEAPNLGVLGASTFPTTGGRNPTLTLQALAWRTADHLVKNWKAIAA